MKKFRKWAVWPLILVLMSGCAPNTPDVPAEETYPAASSADWTFTDGWTASLQSDGGEILTAPGQENAMALYDSYSLGDAWAVDVNAMPQGGSIRVLLGKSSGDVKLAASVNIDGEKAQLSVEEWRGEKWKTVSAAGDWIPFDESEPLELTVCRYAGQENIRLTLHQADQELAFFKATGLTERALSTLRIAGLGADGKAVFTGFSVGSVQKPENPMEALLKTIHPDEEGFYQAIAKQAVTDVIANFWTGDTQTGKIRPTWGGFSGELPDARGGPWETAMLIFEIYDMWAITGDPYYYDLLNAEARFFREEFTEEEMENAGGLFNWACDDCAWNALLYLCFYSVTQDAWFIDRTIGLLDNVNLRWYDEDLNGLLYKDNVDFMSLYEVGIAWSWLRLWEITGEQRFYDLALRSYEGMHDRLGADRDDGLYYCEANKNWPRGEKDGIHEAGSTSFLTGNMGMAALSAKFYRLTGEQEYLERVYKTNEGLLRYYNNDGVLLNDRDAWTNGTFAAFYASEVLNLPDTEQMQALLKSSAESIVTNARTEEGYYGGSWSGPAEGSGSVWYMGGSVPEQSMTTGASVLIVTAAAILEAGIRNYVR